MNLALKELKSFEALEGSVNDDFYTDYFEMNFEIMVNIEAQHFCFTFDNRFSLKDHKTFP